MTLDDGSHHHPEGWGVVTEAASMGDVLEPHDVAIYDLGDDHGQATYQDLQRLHDEGVPVIGLVYDEEQDSVPAELGDAFPVITLSITPEQLLQVLQVTTPARAAGSSTTGSMSLPSGLNEQEFRTIELLGEGLTNQQIAKELYVSVNTVKTYIRASRRWVSPIAPAPCSGGSGTAWPVGRTGVSPSWGRGPSS